VKWDCVNLGADNNIYQVNEKTIFSFIRHDITDERNTNKRFVADGWVYIDSLTRKIYEYDLTNDSLIEWK
jgi:hypothetical protein